ncbi:hypothetical protein D3C78_1973930 [compost metagenome]
MKRVVGAGEDFAKGFVGQGVEAAEHHHMAQLAEPMLVGEEHQQLLAGIEPAAGQVQPDFPSQHRQM